MRFEFDYYSARTRKSRLYVSLSHELRAVAGMIAVLCIVSGIAVWLFGPHVLGALLVSIGSVISLPLLWYHYDIKHLRPTLNPSAPAAVALQDVLSPDILGRLHDISSTYNLWRAVKGTWYQKVFCARFGIHPDTFEHLPKEKDEAAVQSALRKAYDMSIADGLTQLSPVCIMIALMASYPNYDDILSTLKLDDDDLDEGVRWIHHHRGAIDEIDDKNKTGGLARDWTAGFTPTLNSLSFKISDFIESGGLAHQSLGSHNLTIDEMIQDLTRPRPNVVLIGEVGSGKTMTVNGFAKRILQDKTVPELVRFHRVYQISASAILSSSSDPSQVESSLYSIIVEASKSKNAILFFDNAINMFSDGQGAVDLSRALLEVMKSGSAPVILEMTPTEWQQVSQTHQEFAGLVNILNVPEANEANTMDIVEDHVLQLEASSGVVFTYRSLKECVAMSDRYVQGLVQPGKAISLLESSVGHAEGTTVTEKSIQQTIEAVYGVKAQVADAVEGKELLGLEDQIHERMINQTRAVKVVSDALRRARSGVSNPNKPIGTFLFLGPTGVGKTELAKALSDKYFGDESKIVRVDMNEFTQSSDMTRLLDTTSASSFLSAVGRQRFTVVLFDEIEKAHPDIVNAFLQLLDEGEMRDSANRVVSFRDAVVIGTSNAGADKIRAYIDQGKDVAEFEKPFINELIDSGLFKPEFLNRFDETVVFRPLKAEELLQVTDLLIASVNATLYRQKVSVELSDEAKQWLVKEGNDPRLGARPLKRMVQRTVENIVAKRLLEGTVSAGQVVSLTEDDLKKEMA